MITAKQARQMSSEGCSKQGTIVEMMLDAVKRAALDGAYRCHFADPHDVVRDDDLQILRNLGYSIVWDRVYLCYEISWNKGE